MIFFLFILAGALRCTNPGGVITEVAAGSAGAPPDPRWPCPDPRPNRRRPEEEEEAEAEVMVSSSASGNCAVKSSSHAASCSTT